MTIKMYAATLGLTAALLGFGCDKDSSQTAIPHAVSGSAVTPDGAPGASAASMGGVYDALSDIDGSSNRRHQHLMLKTDGTAELDTSEVLPSKAEAATGKHTATGTYIAKGDDITVNFAIEDGKPIPATNTTHVMHLTAKKGEKSLVGDDGRTFELAK
jgi:hypothetical protein